MSPASLEQARAAKRKLDDLLRDCEDVRGIGIAVVKGGYGVKVNFAGTRPAGIPDDVDGVPVIVDVVGPAQLF